MYLFLAKFKLCKKKKNYHSEKRKTPKKNIDIWHI